MGASVNLTQPGEKTVNLKGGQQKLSKRKYNRKKKKKAKPEKNLKDRAIRTGVP